MSRPNFYQLLGLPINPPENDPQKIKQVLRKKQTEWSRYRNHPTKGMQVRQYIGLVTEIERVMSDPDLREKEAKEAARLLMEEAKQKLITTDRHVALLLSKGSIGADEITWLAEKHRIKKRTVFRRVQANDRGMFAKIGRQLDAIAKKRKVKNRDVVKLAKQLGVDVATIESRIESDRKNKFAEIDRYLNVRTTKEYITDEELSGLANIFQFPESEILRRIKCPIRKKSEISADKINPLDKTIENVIEENLRIVGKSSLYDFLGLWIGSSLESLHKRTGEKDAEIRRISQKNVFVTASSILVGHCMSIFKTAESRNAYDLSKARSQLKELNEDIEVAGMSGTVRAEYLEVLIRQAVGFGVDPDEASAYIRGYCSRQGWEVEALPVAPQRPKKSSRKPLILLAGITVAIALVAVLYGMWGQLFEGEYEDIMKQNARLDRLEEKKELLTRFQASHPRDKHTDDLARQIVALDQRIVERDYRQAKAEAEAFIEQGRFKEAENVLAAYLAKHPDSPGSGEMEAQKAGIPLLFEGHRFEALSALPQQAYGDKIAAYSTYLAEFPQGTYREQVIELFLAMQSPFYSHILAQVEDCDRRREWRSCLRLCNEFINVYAGSEQADQLKGLREDLLQRVEEAKELEELKTSARMAGNDLEAAQQVYVDYLDRKPAASTRKEIERAIALIDEEETKAQLNATHGRFIEKRADVITDTATGLMWALPDFRQTVSACVTFEAALQYVKALTTGGFNDWRLPTPGELRGIYKKKPYFPFGDGKWFWSSTSYKRYADGWFRVVDVVTAERATRSEEITRHEKECGAVQAVRP